MESMKKVRCPRCGISGKAPLYSIGRQVGCIKCRQIYILSEHYPDVRFKKTILVILFCVVAAVASMFYKLQADYNFFGMGIEKAKQGIEFLKEIIPEQERADDNVLSFNKYESSYGSRDEILARKSGELLPEHKNRQVKWGGEVAEVGTVKGHLLGDFYVKFRQHENSLSDVTVFFLDADAESLKDLKKGEYVNYQGILVSSAHGRNNHVLKRGKIVNRPEPINFP